MDLLIFDLDGTLIDSRRDLADAVNAARGQMGLEPLAETLIYTYVGNGAPMLLRRALGPDAPQSDVDRALALFLQHYRGHLLDHTRLYAGVREALDALLEAGLPMAVLTNKPLFHSNAIVAGLGLSGHFFRVYGGDSFERKKPDPTGLETLMREAGVAQPDRVVMIGDSGIDIRTARNAGVRACGVTYGFQPDSLDADPPDWRIGDMRELLPIVLV